MGCLLGLRALARATSDLRVASEGCNSLRRRVPLSEVPGRGSTIHTLEIRYGGSPAHEPLAIASTCKFYVAQHSATATTLHGTP